MSNVLFVALAMPRQCGLTHRVVYGKECMVDCLAQHVYDHGMPHALHVVY